MLICAKVAKLGEQTKRLTNENLINFSYVHLEGAGARLHRGHTRHQWLELGFGSRRAPFAGVPRRLSMLRGTGRHCCEWRHIDGVRVLQTTSK